MTPGVGNRNTSACIWGKGIINVNKNEMTAKQAVIFLVIGTIPILQSKQIFEMGDPLKNNIFIT
jgi:hypothetical protein